MSVTIVKPTVGADNGIWGTELNAALDALNAADYFRGKTADQSLTSVTTLTDDTALTMALPVGTFVMNEALMVTGAAAADFKVALAFSGTAANAFRAGQGPSINSTDATGAAAAATTVGVMRAAAAGGTSTAINSVSAYGTDGTNISLIMATGFLVVTVAGTLKVQWAQNTSTASATTVKAGSYLWLRQVA